MSTPVPSPSTPAVPEGVGYACMVASSFTFAVMGACVKLACEHLPFYEVSFFRAFGGLLITGVVMGVGRLPFQPRDPGLLVLRGVFGWAALMTYFLAVSGLHLADAVLLNYTSPFFTALLAAILLKERLSLRTGLCLLTASAGVACVLGPTGGFWNWSGIAALASAMLAALAYVAVKRATLNNTPWTIVASFSCVASVLTLPFLIWRYQAPTASQWGLLAAVAGTGTLAQLLMTYGYRHARASTASVITLFTPLFAALLSIAFFSLGPTWGTWLGGGLILGAGWALFTQPAPEAKPLA